MPQVQYAGKHRGIASNVTWGGKRTSNITEEDAMGISRAQLIKLGFPCDEHFQYYAKPTWDRLGHVAPAVSVPKSKRGFLLGNTFGFKKGNSFGHTFGFKKGHTFGFKKGNTFGLQTIPLDQRVGTNPKCKIADYPKDLPYVFAALEGRPVLIAEACTLKDIDSSGYENLCVHMWNQPRPDSPPITWSKVMNQIATLDVTPYETWVSQSCRYVCTSQKMLYSMGNEVLEDVSQVCFVRRLSQPDYNVVIDGVGDCPCSFGADEVPELKQREWHNFFMNERLADVETHLVCLDKGQRIFAWINPDNGRFLHPSGKGKRVKSAPQEVTQDDLIRYRSFLVKKRLANFRWIRKYHPHA